MFAVSVGAGTTVGVRGPRSAWSTPASWPGSSRTRRPSAGATASRSFFNTRDARYDADTSVIIKTNAIRNFDYTKGSYDSARDSVAILPALSRGRTRLRRSTNGPFRRRAPSSRSGTGSGARRPRRTTGTPRSTPSTSRRRSRSASTPVGLQCGGGPRLPPGDRRHRYRQGRPPAQEDRTKPAWPIRPRASTTSYRRSSSVVPSNAASGG